MFLTEMLQLFNLDVKTLIAVLFWGNLISVLLIFTYQFSSKTSYSQLTSWFSIGKLIQSVSYFMLFFRGSIPEILSVNVGNMCLFVGFYLETVSMMYVFFKDEENTGSIMIETMILFACIVMFNVVEFVYPDPGLRIVFASIAIFAILAIPNIKVLLYTNVSIFKRFTGVFNLIFIMLLVPRIFHALFYPVDIHTNFVMQNLTFLAMVLLMIFSLTSYLLLTKENDEKIISDIAARDGLTGLTNRHSFFQNANSVFNNIKGTNTAVSVLFWDIDNFKSINDTYGHLFGDVVLTRVGAVILECLRGEDLSCRYGGEEFVILVYGPNISTKSIASRIMTGIKNSTFQDHPDFHFTVSGGIMTGCPTENDTLLQYIENSDKALYAAKKSGKNKTVLFSEEIYDSDQIISHHTSTSIAHSDTAIHDKPTYKPHGELNK